MTEVAEKTKKATKTQYVVLWRPGHDEAGRVGEEGPRREKRGRSRLLMGDLDRPPKPDPKPVKKPKK